MFFCDPCGKRNGWQKGFRGSFGRCECCGKQRECSDVPSSHLPLAKRNSRKAIKARQR